MPHSYWAKVRSVGFHDCDLFGAHAERFAGADAAEARQDICRLRDRSAQPHKDGIGPREIERSRPACDGLAHWHLVGEAELVRFRQLALHGEIGHFAQYDDCVVRVACRERKEPSLRSLGLDTIHGNPAPFWSHHVAPADRVGLRVLLGLSIGHAAV